MKDKSNNREPKFFSRIVNSSRVSVAFMFYFLLSTFYCSAQDSIVVSGQFVNNTKYAKVLMKKFEVGSFPIGGASIKNETFSLSLPPDIEPGPSLALVCNECLQDNVKLVKCRLLVANEHQRGLDV